MILSILVTVVGFAALVVIHELGHWGLARLFGMKVERFSVGFGPVIWKKQRGDTEWALSAIPFGGYVRITGMAPGDAVDPEDRGIYSNQAAWRRFLVIFGGPAMNYLTAILIAMALLAVSGFREPDPSATLGRIEAGPGKEAGLLAGDKVLTIDEEPIEDWEGFAKVVRAHPETPITLHVARPGAGELDIVAKPAADDGVGRLRIAQNQLVVHASIGEAIYAGFLRTNERAYATLAGLANVKPKDVGGAPRILEEMVKSAERGATDFVQMVWYISIMLALFNLLPVPALDGGRLVFLVIELVTGRKVNQRVESLVHFIGFVALFALVILISGRDILRMVGR